MFTPGETNIICTDLEASLHFYRNVLGFKVIGKEGAAAVHMRCGDRPFLLLAVASSPIDRSEYGAVPTLSIDLMVDDIETAVVHLKDNQVEFEKEWKPGELHTFIRDPDGLVWEIIEEMEETK
jgi:catechol 2,3-dioxygenase-like lactoylglutathione lyase family enzyme